MWSCIVQETFFLCANEDGWGDGTKVPTCFPASTENIHKPRDMIRGSEQPEKRLVRVILGLPEDNGNLTTGRVMATKLCLENIPSNQCKDTYDVKTKGNQKWVDAK